MKGLQDMTHCNVTKKVFTLIKTKIRIETETNVEFYFTALVVKVVQLQISCNTTIDIFNSDLSLIMILQIGFSGR